MIYKFSVPVLLLSNVSVTDQCGLVRSALGHAHLALFCIYSAQK